MADAQCGFKSHLLHLPFWKRMRKCRNWQTSKTKDLVLVTACGFKSHLPHEKGNRQIPFFLSVIFFHYYCFAVRQKIMER